MHFGSRVHCPHERSIIIVFPYTYIRSCDTQRCNLQKKNRNRRTTGATKIILNLERNYALLIR